ncbi:MAG: GNAT family N-acetyltransferase [Frankia sp.]
MIRLEKRPALVPPTADVKVSYLVGEQADCLVRGTPTDWLGPASEDFDGLVAARRGIHTRWGVPCTISWYISGDYYLGTLVLRHRLTPELADLGGHIGYHVVAPWRRQGHATRMLADGLDLCRRHGLQRVLLTTAPDNAPSRRVILANGGVPDGRRHGEDHFWISLGQDSDTHGPAIPGHSDRRL